VENSRAVFAILLAVAAIVALGEFFRILLRGRPIPKLLFMFTLLGCGIFYEGVVAIYTTAASSGMLGTEAREKFELQTEGGLGVLLGGRSELLVSTQAIADSPIIGHGSWAKDYEYVARYVWALEERGAAIVGDPFHNALIPSHSFLFGSWVEAGILGGAVWIYILAICGRSLYSLFDSPAWSRPLITFVTLSLMWDVLFSPFGATERFFVPAALCIVLWTIRNEYSKTSFQRRKAGRAT
jgi:O-antigen ligase